MSYSNLTTAGRDIGELVFAVNAGPFSAEKARQAAEAALESLNRSAVAGGHLVSVARVELVYNATTGVLVALAYGTATSG
ncbi:hypothetical protein [Streptosporangium carneum]|uniref:Uncharacterized protein n=1 Tax=Streptosporangium carneum TaxID=47481 RepID=A0A9W6I5X4_9ACTN|nr:hypothetical protein [Streptosporangium carneum]GLK12692.1 hypothetical protein GCM10017600_61020 [Streptosporangium carneum]